MIENELLPTDARFVIGQILRSVAQCHAKNVVMRDVKPGARICVACSLHEIHHLLLNSVV